MGQALLLIRLASSKPGDNQPLRKIFSRSAFIRLTTLHFPEPALSGFWRIHGKSRTVGRSSRAACKGVGEGEFAMQFNCLADIAGVAE